MIIWVCDGCGGRQESLWVESPDMAVAYYVRRNVYQTCDPTPPPKWWVAHVSMKVKVSEYTDRTVHKAFLACCGTCMDKVIHAQPERKLEWRQQGDAS